mgnify:CR=1 FL=1
MQKALLKHNRVQKSLVLKIRKNGVKNTEFVKIL